MPPNFIDLIYIDPPFNTGKIQQKTQLKTVRSETGSRTGFQGNRYESIVLGVKSFRDLFDDYMAFIEPRLLEAHRVLAPHGSLYFHIDYREVHYCKVLLDEIFGRECFLNEIIWAYDYGGRSKKKWPTKHENILLYVKDRSQYIFNSEDIERIPYMAPGMVGVEKAKKGKLPTDTWWHTIVPTNGSEKTGYPTQKPLGVLRRIIQASSKPGGVVMDFFAGSGTTGAAAPGVTALFDEAHCCFTLDFRGTALYLEGRRVRIDERESDGWEEGFWHVVSQGNRQDGSRTPDCDRCCRVPWIRPIIENAGDTQWIKMWRNNRRQDTRVLLWLEAADYLVVLSARRSTYHLVTAYSPTYSHTVKKLRKEYEAYKAAAAR